ncbi:MAG: DUF2892 domain-containing protein [Rhodospirillales bacterium]|nr:DUF2892 domain-containing protein [Alphaproteobacteria bacterium]MBL6947197.1 DUF2892 domain-containing protein [Rhodospirillales bacterium]
MKTNVGNTDRILRFLAGAALVAFALLGPGVAYQWLGWIGVPVMLTAVFKFCPAYPLLGISTMGKKKEEPEAES